MLVYTSRKTALFRHLANACIPFPTEAKGYIMMRDAKISANSWDTFQTWNKLEDVAETLSPLERPAPGHGGRATTHLGAFVQAGAEGYATSGFQFALEHYTQNQRSQWFCGFCGGQEEEFEEKKQLHATLAVAGPGNL